VLHDLRVSATCRDATVYHLAVKQVVMEIQGNPFRQVSPHRCLQVHVHVRLGALAGVAHPPITVPASNSSPGWTTIVPA